MENFLQEAKTYTELISQKIVKLEINGTTDLEQCQSILAYNKELGKEIQAKKEAITKPLNASLKEVRALFKPLEDKLDEVEKIVKGAMLDFKRKLDEERKAEILKMQESDEQEPTAEMIATAKVMETIKTRKVKKLNIIDQNLIPDFYWIPNEQMIFDTLKTGGHVLGCELIDEEIVINNY